MIPHLSAMVSRSQLSILKGMILKFGPALRPLLGQIGPLKGPISKTSKIQAHDNSLEVQW